MSNLQKYELQKYELNLDDEMIQKYICPTATPKERFAFLQLCKAQDLNPFLREIYLVKYGNEPATYITGKETFLKRAAKHPKYAGHKTYIDGTIPDMTATAEVYLTGYQCPITCTVDYDEYVGKKKDGTPNRMWSEKPKTMLKKVALVQALREAFPDDLGGLYDQAEINTIPEELTTKPIDLNQSTSNDYKEPRAKENSKEKDNILKAIKQTFEHNDVKKEEQIEMFLKFSGGISSDKCSLKELNSIFWKISNEYKI